MNRDEVDEQAEVETTDERASDEASGEQLPDQLPEELDPNAERWVALDERTDFRDDGPFDLNEVDLDADDIDRLDFGSVILTPFDEMQLQLQIDENTSR